MRNNEFCDLFLILFMCVVFNLSGWSQEVPFHRGVNLTNWFQASHPGAIQLGKYRKSDFENIKSLGCDVIRLPINLHAMTSGSPDFIPDPLFLFFLDSAVAWADDLKLHLILDNHTFDPSDDTEPEIETALVKVWGEMAQHYSGKYENLYYEILNEPHNISDELWGSIQQKAIDAIREFDQEHMIIVGGSGWNGFRNLDSIPEYTDDKLIYTFHFYEPFLFTHQGATWNVPTMDDLKGIPFPYKEGEMPGLADRYKGTWIEDIYNRYPTEGTVESVKRLIDIAADFRDKRQVPVFCGEFGVYNATSDPDDRVEWYRVVREYLEEKDISWTIWDYHHGFGIFKKGEQDLFDHNLNTDLLESLGLDVPPQTPYEKKPDTTGMIIYGDFIHPKIVEASYGAGKINYYSPDSPNYGKYCIEWSDPDEFNIIGLDFIPDKDFTTLVSREYFLDFFIRTTAADLRLDIRFLDADTGEADHPWRNRVAVKVNGNDPTPGWKHFQLPLSQFEEQGAWENEWFDPEGKFSWANIDRLEIATEDRTYVGDTTWIDQMVLTNQDTSSILSTTLETGVLPNEVKLYPNPCTSDIMVSLKDSSTPWDIKIYTLDGKLLYQHVYHEPQISINTRSWNSGMYILTANMDNGKTISRRFLKN